MTILTQGEIHQLLERFPPIELSYETTPHKKVPPSYNICLGIPTGKKCFIWFSFYGNKNQCFILELNKERKIGKVDCISFPINHSNFLGTLLYGTFYSKTEETSENLNDRIFLIEDIFFYKGIPMKGLFFGEKLGFLENFFQENRIEEQGPFLIRLPLLWAPMCNKGLDYECVYEVPNIYQTFYPIHHIQYRSLNDIVPYLNTFPTKKTIGTSNTYSKPIDELIQTKPKYKPDLHKHQYKLPTVFVAKADIAFDIYRLYAYGASKELIFYGIAYISNYKTSVFMNGIFRKIKENINLDYIEESDDEEDFENIEVDKYVDLKKSVLIECKWLPKFKKWLPVKTVDGFQKVIHIRQLVSDYPR